MSSRPTRPPLLALHVAPAVPLALLSAWFGLVDTAGPGEVRCSSCGVETHVTVLHVIAGAVLAGAVLGAARVAADADPAAPRRASRTRRWLAVVALCLVASLVWPPVFEPYAFVMLFASLVAAPVVSLWWAVDLVRLVRDPAPATHARGRLARGLVARSWLSLVVLLPGLYAWVWLSRVEWLIF